MLLAYAAPNLTVFNILAKTLTPIQGLLIAVWHRDTKDKSAE